MQEAAIKANEREALRLFERGVAAARGGQRRVAAGFLSRSVQLNPRHESAWLWLSGVLDDQQEIAFCLQAVLKINPANERALRGLAWLEQRKTSIPAKEEPAKEQPAKEQPVSAQAEATNQWWQRATEQLRTPRPLNADAVLAHELQAHAHGESWWVNFRRSRRDMSRVRMVLWSVPLLLLLFTLALNVSLRSAVTRNEILAQAAALAAVRPLPTPIPVTAATDAEVLLAELPDHTDAEILAYLSVISEPRARLRSAIAEYRAATGRPGGSSTLHATAAQRLRDSLDQAYTTIDAVTPPPAFQQAHAWYLSGLEMELAALDDMLAFYSSFRVENANRAVVRMAEADRFLEQARLTFDQRYALIDTTSAGGHTIR